MENNPTAIDQAKKLLDVYMNGTSEEYQRLLGSVSSVAQALLDCEARCEALEAALAFYAEEHNYKHAAEPSWNTSTAPPTMHYPLGYPCTTVSTDGGKKAREALTPQPALDKDARIAELEAALHQICVNAPVAAPEFQESSNHGDIRDNESQLTHWHLAEIARAALAPRSEDGKGK